MWRNAAAGLIALAASTNLAAQPALAAQPQGLLLSICSDSGTQWRVIPDPQDSPTRRDDHPGLCAHFACPREPRGRGDAA